MPKIFLRLEGLAVLAIAIAIFIANDYNFLWFIALLLAPDVFMVGYLKDSKLGALTYNIGHSYISPVLLAVLAYAIDSSFFYMLVLIWLAHIGMDRLFGYGLKYSDDFKHTHLGKISKK